MHGLKAQSGGVCDQMWLLLLHRKNLGYYNYNCNATNLFDAFNNSIYAFALEFDAVVKPPPYWQNFPDTNGHSA